MAKPRVWPEIKDDLFDYGEAEVGKPRGNDLRGRKKNIFPYFGHELAPADRRWLEKYAPE